MLKDADNIHLSPAERLRIFAMMLGVQRNAEFRFPGGRLSLIRSDTESILVRLKPSNSLILAEFKFCANGRLFSSCEFKNEVLMQNFSNISVDKYLAGLKEYHKIPLAA